MVIEEIKLKKILILISLTVLSIILSQLVLSSAFGITLDSKGRFGCLACHSDKRLATKEDGKTLSLFIDGNKFSNSVHGKLACLDCHTDFSFKDHSQGADKAFNTNFRKTAGLACIRCHQHEKQYKDYLNSIHGRLALSNDVRKGATCGDCHVFKIHAITKTKAYWKDYFYNADKTCGKEGCHRDRFKSYNDYYHGQAYKNKAADAPACWDCHGNHDVDKKGEPNSKINPESIGKTCGHCHPDAQNVFGNSYGGMIHGKDKMTSKNFVFKLFVSGLGVKDAAVGQVNGVYGTFTSWIEGIIKFFFPPSARPRKKLDLSQQG
jgi:hypothetical protein